MKKCIVLLFLLNSLVCNAGEIKNLAKEKCIEYKKDFLKETEKLMKLADIKDNIVDFTFLEETEGAYKFEGQDKYATREEDKYASCFCVYQIKLKSGKTVFGEFSYYNYDKKANFDYLNDFYVGNAEQVLSNKEGFTKRERFLVKRRINILFS